MICQITSSYRTNYSQLVDTMLFGYWSSILHPSTKLKAMRSQAHASRKCGRSGPNLTYRRFLQKRAWRAVRGWRTWTPYLG
jgi:hypothetical protein